MRIGYGYDAHQFSVDRKLILGGVDIPFHKGLWGHSDADVLIHSIIDAILGALAKGDIGTRFPDNDESYRNIDSRILLRKSAGLLHEEHYRICNLDATICAENPKLQPSIPLMRQNIAFDLNCDISQISIKATTEEGMGFTGEEKGISATAVVLITKV
ncbi:MAG: 2-C-methyl-D-erythritol 2,4-cyclodiphosphate synthase [Candidatus Cloacimonadales bacterium]|nr:2-C-methyl-D-erythritol 2,4-cyclodiphosphate synthase [Candidatus Cloacimonadales bacterium]